MRHNLRTAAIAAMIAITGTYLVGTASAAENAAPVPPRTYQVAPNIHVAVLENRNSVYLIGDNKVMLIETNFERNAVALKNLIAGVTPQPVKLIINSHWHGDHMGGNKLFHEAGAISLAHVNARARMAVTQVNPVTNTVQLEAQKPEFLPMMTMDGKMTIHWGGERVDLIHYPAAHTDSDLVFYFRNSNVVYLGGMMEYPTYAGVYSPDGFIDAINAILAETNVNTKLIPWQGPVVTQAELREWRDIIAVMKTHVGALIAQGKTVEEIVAAKPSAQFDAKWGGGRTPARFAQDMHYVLTNGAR